MNTVGIALGVGGIGNLSVQTGGGSDSSSMTYGPFANNSNFMTPEDNLDAAFPCTAKLGTTANFDERPMQAMLGAFSPKTESSLQCNRGFLRDDALLVVIMISDEEDDQGIQNGERSGSAGNPDSWHEAVVASKKVIPKNVVSLSFIGIPYPNNGSVTTEAGEGVIENEAEISIRIRQFTEPMGERGFS